MEVWHMLGDMLEEPHGVGPACIARRPPPSPPAPAQLTESESSLLLASPTMRMAASTSRCPGRQLTQRFRAWDTALATCREAKSGHHLPVSPTPFPQPDGAHWGTHCPHLGQALLALWVTRLGHCFAGLLDEVVGFVHDITGTLQHGTLCLRVGGVGCHTSGSLAE